jgi:methionine-rich copper-binding protein CopC
VTVTTTKAGFATADKSKASDEPITVHIRMGKSGGSASLSVKQNKRLEAGALRMKYNSVSEPGH